MFTLSLHPVKLIDLSLLVKKEVFRGTVVNARLNEEYFCAVTGLSSL